MLKINDDMSSSTNELIKQNHVRHEKHIQWLEKEIRKKDAMNRVMRDVLIKLICATWNVVYIPNNKFDEMLVILDKTFSPLKAQDFTTKAYDALTEQLNTSFQWVFEWLDELKTEFLLALEVGPSHARGEKEKEQFNGNLSNILCSEMNQTMTKFSRLKLLNLLR